MKVGIISINMYSKGLNFACPTHTYAFQQFLLQNGIDCTVINYKPIYYDNFDLKYPAHYYEKLVASSLEKKAKTQEEQKELKTKQKKYQHRYKSWTALSEERATRYEKMQRFIDTYYVKTETCYDSDLLEVMDPGFDCYICATDVIWKNQPGFGFDRGFFLGSTCMEQKWKIAYSASRGVYLARNAADEAQFFHYLEDMDAISVREKSLKKYIEKNSDLKVTQVLDPVLLHEASFYDKILIAPPERHYLLLYYVMEKANDTIKAAIDYAARHDLQIIEITDNPVPGGKIKRFSDCDYTFRYDIGIEQWLGYIKYADCIFTNSFHCTCFSILFEKDFYVGYRVNDKIQELLKMMGLTKRSLARKDNPSFSDKATWHLKKGVRDYLPSLANHLDKIDYSKVRLCLEKKRAESQEFILSAIHSCENAKRPAKDYMTYKKNLTYKLYYNSGRKGDFIGCAYDNANGTVAQLPSGSVEYRPDILCKNDGTEKLLENKFQIKGYSFVGWILRLRIDNRWFWYMDDGTLTLKEIPEEDRNGTVHLFQEGANIPPVPVNHIAIMVADAVWKEERMNR